MEKWDGDASPLRRDLELLLKPISEAFVVSKTEKKVKHKNPEEYVSILSGVEFFRGYVKVKFVITNDLDNVVTDAMVKIIVKQDSLRIGWVEPADYALQGDNIVIGNVQPGEKIHVEDRLASGSPVFFILDNPPPDGSGLPAGSTSFWTRWSAPPLSWTPR